MESSPRTKQRDMDVRRATSSPERERLLNLVVDLILRDGVIDLSLSAISRSIGSSNRMLLYYFTSKEELLDEAAAVGYQRFPRLGSMFERMAQPGPLRERLDTAWEDIAAPENRPYLALYFQRFGIAMRDREQWHDAIDRSTHHWAEDLAAILVADGIPSREAVVASTQIVAVWRGLQLALLASADEALVRVACRTAMRGALAQAGHRAAEVHA